MATKDVTRLRREGKLDEAYAMAQEELEAERNEWTCMSMFWVLRDYVQNVYLPEGNIEKCDSVLAGMEELLPIIKDDNLAGRHAYDKLLKQCRPNAVEIINACELSKTDPVAAYDAAIAVSGKHGEKLDATLHNDLGWILYSYLKAKMPELESVKVRKLLRDYTLLNNNRPSTLHSAFLNLAIKFSKGHPDFNFRKFFLMWNPKNLRPEDYDDTNKGDAKIPSLVSRICRVIVESGEVFNVEEFVDAFNIRNDDIIEHLRESSFWKLMGCYKENGIQEFVREVEAYAEMYPVLGPSHWHSEILKLANRTLTEENAWHFFCIAHKWYAGGNFMPADYKPEIGKDGREYPSIASKVAKKCFEVVKGAENLKRDHGILEWVKAMYRELTARDPEDDWSYRNYATVCLWEGDKNAFTECYLELLTRMPEKFYLWSELAECTDDLTLKTGLLLKAKSLERNEDFLGDIHLALADALLAQGDAKYASRELGIYIKHRTEKGWSIPKTYEVLKNRVDNTMPLTPIDAEDCIRAAEDFAYSKFEKYDFVLTEKWMREKTEICNFYNADGMEFHIKSSRNALLRKAKPGWVFSIRVDVKVTRIVPLTFQRKDVEPWSVLPENYGVVEYVNEAKKVLHILTAGSRLVFYKFKKTTIQEKAFVKFRVYTKVTKERSQACAVDLWESTKEEVLSHMQSCLMVVDDVNASKSLFHVTRGKNISSVVKYSETEMRPNVGDFLLVTYCLKKDKEGKTRIKILDLQNTSETDNSLKRTVQGKLELKYKGAVWFDGTSLMTPDFGFINDYYVHKKVIEKFHITEDCYVVAQAMVDGDNKWRIYHLQVKNVCDG